MAKTKRLTNKDDNFTGTTGDDHVLGLNGNDKINGGKGADILVGGNGNDTLNGGADNDTLKGNAGDDKLLGASGNDRINGGAGNDNMQGGAGDDVITATSGNDKVDGGDGEDKVVLKGNFADATITETAKGFKIELGGNTITVKNVEHFKFSDQTVDAEDLRNHDPSAAATQNLSGTEDTAVTGAVGATDSDGDTLTYSVPATGSTDGPAHGSVTVDASGNFTYTPTANYNGTDSFVVTVSDGKGGQTTQIVNITLAAVDDAPTADATQAVSGTEDTAVTGTVVATDIDGDTLTYSVPSSGSDAPQHGTVSFDANGNFTYTPTADYNGTDTFTVTIDDGHGKSTQQVITVTLDPTEDAPTAPATQDVSGDEDTAITGSIGATDVDNDTLTYTVPASGDTGAPAHGTVTIDADGNYTYTPAADFNGTDSFVVTIDDGNGGTTTQTINVTVDAVNDAPVITGVTDVQILDNGRNTPANTTGGSLFPAFSASDVEGDLGPGAKLTVTSDDGSDFFGFNTNGGVTVAANVVLVNGEGVGTFTANPFGQIVITFNGDATAADIDAVAQAITVGIYDSQTNSWSHGGSSNISITLTDNATDSATSETTTIEVVSTATSNAVSIGDLNGDSQVTGVANAALAVDKGTDASVTYLSSVGVGNVDDVKMTIALGGESDPSDVLTIPTSLDTTVGHASIANISGTLVYQDSSGNQYNVGTVTQTGTTITISLSNDVSTSSSLQAGDFDNVLSLVIQSTKVDAANDDGVRDVTFTIDGVGNASATATAHLVVTDGGTIELTDDSNTATPLVKDGDTNASLGTIDPAGINVFDAAAGTLQTADNFSGGSTVNDILTAVLDNSLGIVAPTISGIETFNLSSNGANAGLNAAGINNTNAMTINITGGNAISVTNIGSTFDTVDASGSSAAVTLTTQNGQSLDVTTGSGATSITALDSVATQAVITVDASDGAALTLSGTADFSIEGSAVGAINASATSDSLTIADVAGDSTFHMLSLTTGTGAVTVEDIEIGSTLTINAALMADDTLLKVSGEGGVSVTSFIGSLDASGLSGSLNVVLGDDGSDPQTTAITIGSGLVQSVTGAASTDVINIDATAAVPQDLDSDPSTPDVVPNLTVAGAGAFNISNVTADISATGATGLVTINTLAGADITVTAGTQTALMGAADNVSITAAAAGGTITIGSAADDFAGGVAVTALADNGTVVASHLTGELTVDTAMTGDASITLAAGVSAFDLTSSNTSTTIDATAFAGMFMLDGAAGVVTANNVGSITIDANGNGAVAPATITTDFMGTLDVNLIAHADTTIIAGAGDVTVTGGDVDANTDDLVDGTRGLISIDATDITATHAVTVNDSADGFNLDVSVTGLSGGTSVNLVGSAEVAADATTTLATALLDSTDTVSVVLGTSETVNISSSSTVGSIGTVTVNAAAAVQDDFDHDGSTATPTAETNVQITLTGNSAYVLSNVSADVHASAATGSVTIGASAATLALSLTTGSGDDTVTAGSGDDTITVGNGENSVVGGAGKDHIIGGTGSDTIDGGAGQDTLTGGSETVAGDGDVFVFKSGETSNLIASADHITDFAINVDQIDLSDYHLSPSDPTDPSAFSHLSIAVGGGSTVITIDGGDKIVLDGSYIGQTFTADQFIF